MPDGSISAAELAEELKAHLFPGVEAEALAHSARPFGIVPWWPGRVAWKRDAELAVNALSLLPDAQRIRWRIIHIPATGGYVKAVVFSG